MIIRSVTFAGSVATTDSALPGDLPQVAFAGRSNVGKSSLINVLLGRTRRKIAHVSSKPGKTQTLNFYRVNDRFYLVDLPGFGYARAPAAVREGWTHLIHWYLSREEGPSGIVHLVDGRHPPTRIDRELAELLGELQIPALVILTKMDRVSKGKRKATLETASKELGVGADQLLFFSSRTGEGREVLLDALDDLLPEPENRRA